MAFKNPKDMGLIELFEPAPPVQPASTEDSLNNIEEGMVRSELVPQSPTVIKK